MSTWSKLIGTQTGKFILGLLGVTLKNNAGNLDVRNNADTAYANINVGTAKVNGATYGTTIGSSASQTGNLTITLPANAGTSGQVLGTDGAGVTSWVSAADTSICWKTHSIPVSFGDGSTITGFTLPAGAVLDFVDVIVDTAWDSTPTLSVGITADNSKYVGSGDLLLTSAGKYNVPNLSIPDGTSEAINVYYSAASSTVGAARVLVTYSNPTP